MTPKRATSALLLILLVLLTSPLLARYVMPDLELVPLERLITNLEQRVDANPNDFDAVHTLARTHAMAYSWRLESDTEVAVYTTRPKGEPYFGLVPRHVPFRADRWAQGWRDAHYPERLDAPARSRSDQADARAHLDRAIELYRRAIQLTAEPGDRHPYDLNFSQLGLSWCLASRGDHQQAAALLRELVARLGPEAAAEGSAPPNGFPVEEAIEDLLSLIGDGHVEPHDDEIAELTALEEHIEPPASLPRAITPLAIDLTGAASSPTSLINDTASVTFDLDGSGRQLQWTWIRIPSAAWLVWDPDQLQPTGLHGEPASSATRCNCSATAPSTCCSIPRRLRCIAARTPRLHRRQPRRHDQSPLNGPELVGLALWHDAQLQRILRRPHQRASPAK